MDWVIPIDKLNYKFNKKPILIGGKAMEYYGLRKSGVDIDLIADEKDILELIKLYPKRVKDLWGDLGVCPFNFEIWRTIRLLNYDDLKEGAIDIGNILVISKEKLLLVKALAMEDEKYLKDLKLLVKYITDNKYKNLNKEILHNQDLLKGIKNITYLEKTGPEDKEKAETTVIPDIKKDIEESRKQIKKGKYIPLNNLK